MNDSFVSKPILERTVFCAGMIRSGSTLQFQIAAHLVEARRLGRRWPYFAPSELDEQLGSRVGELGFSVIKTHVMPAAAPAMLRSGRAVALYSYRDLRDVALSAMRNFHVSWEQFRDERWLDNALDAERNWLTEPLVLVQRYEDMIAALPRTVAEIAAHIGIELRSGEAEAIAQLFGIESQKERIRRFESVATSDQMFEPEELLRRHHIHNAQIGGWRTDLEPHAATEITQRYSGWLESHGYSLVAAIAKHREGEELCFIPHIGWLAFQPGDVVLAGLREGDFEYLEQAALFRMLRPGDVFIDCGAHCGLYTRLAACLVGREGRVVGVEPNPTTFRLLAKNIADLPSEMVSIYAYALGATDGRARFVDAGYGKAAYNHLAPNTAHHSSFEVDILTLETLFKRLKLARADFVKLDTEGSEFAILSAARKLLEKGKIGTLMIEFNEQNLARYDATGAGLAALLREYGYEIFEIDPVRFELTRVPEGGGESYVNFFATTDEGWLRTRLENCKGDSVRAASEILLRGAHVAAFKQRIYGTVSEQTKAFSATEQECKRLSALVEQRVNELKHNEGVVREQSELIVVLRREGERLGRSEEELRSQIDSLRTENQRHIDGLLVQLREVAKTSREQELAMVATENERQRLAALVDKRTGEVQKNLGVIREQSELIAVLRWEVERLKSREDELVGTLARVSEENQRQIDDLLKQLNNLAQTTREQEAVIVSVKQEHLRLDAMGQKRAAEVSHYLSVVQEQSNLITVLRKEQDRLESQEARISGELAECRKKCQSDIDELLVQVKALARTAQEQEAAIGAKERERQRLEILAVTREKESTEQIKTIRDQAAYIELLRREKDRLSVSEKELAGQLVSQRDQLQNTIASLLDQLKAHGQTPHVDSKETNSLKIERQQVRDTDPQ